MRKLLFGTPDIDPAVLADIARDFEAVKLNIKAFGYDLGRRLAEALPVPESIEARHVGLASKAATSADIESDWVAYWAREIRSAIVYHRKLWEMAYILQALYEQGQMRPGARALGFGCGREPIPSVLAARGVAVTVTDLAPEEARAQGWIAGNQHADTRETTFNGDIIDRETFDRLVGYRSVDMNAIPADLAGFDSCWSCCALEHLGNIDLGLAFIHNALATLRPGGIAVHTTELNVVDGPTVESGVTVLFQRRHFEAIAAELRAEGHEVAPLDFDYGDKPMDNFIDVPPWWEPKELDGIFRHPRHLKLCLDGHIVTCFGLIIRKRG